MPSQVLTLSESNGGAPILLDSSHLPGKLIHLNPVDSGGNDLVRDVLVGNLNTRQISIWTKIMGPGVDPVYDRSEMLRIDVPPSAEGTQVRQFYTPFVLEPGYSYYISVDLQPGDVPPYLYGYVERFTEEVPTEPEPEPTKRYPGMLIGGPADSFTLNTTDSKLVNYERGGQWNWEDQLDVNRAAGEIIIPQDGLYNFVTNVIGNQGNSTKEEDIALKHDVQGGPEPGRTEVAHLTVSTDKTSVRHLLSVYAALCYKDEVHSLYMWASAGLGTFTVLNSSFEVIQVAYPDDVLPHQPAVSRRRPRRERTTQR